MKLNTAGLIVIKKRRLLLAFSNNKAAFYLPGGKVDDGETTEDCLCREIAEELNIEIEKSKLSYYMHVTAPAFGEANGIVMEQECFMYDMNETPTPSKEIGALDYFDKEMYSKQPAQVPGVWIVINKLIEEGLID